MTLQNPQAADHLAASAGEFEPQRTNNFSIEIPLGGQDKDLIIAALEGFTMPTTKNEIQEMKYQNETRKVAGPANVEQGNLKLKDFCDIGVRWALLRWRKQVYDKTTGKVGLAKNYKKTCFVVLHGPDGSNERVAKLLGVFPPEDPPDALDMSSPAPIMMEMPLSSDKVLWKGIDY